MPDAPHSGPVSDLDSGSTQLPSYREQNRKRMMFEIPDTTGILPRRCDLKTNVHTYTRNTHDLPEYAFK
jgi:hypothetical protein